MDLTPAGALAPRPPGTADVFVTATGNFNIITAAHMARMKDKAIVSNIGHFDNEIDMAGLAKTKGITKEQADYLGVPVDGPYKPDHYRY